MKRYFTALTLAGIMAGATVFVGTVACAAENDVTSVLAEYGLNGEDILAIANVYKQTNEGNDPHLEGKDW